VGVLTPPAGQAATPSVIQRCQKSKSSQGTGPCPQHSFRRRRTRQKASRESGPRRQLADRLREIQNPAAQDHIKRRSNPACNNRTAAFPASCDGCRTLNGKLVLYSERHRPEGFGLTLFQRKMSLFGAGKIRGTATNTLDVTVSGSVQTNGTIELDKPPTSPIKPL